MFKLIFKIINFIIIIAIIVALYAFYIEPKLLISRTETIATGKLMEELTIVHFTDTHIGPDYSIEQLEKLVKKINAKKPDIILFTGDLVDVARDFEGIYDISPTLKKLTPKLGKFAIYGNHDHGGGAHRYYNDIMTESDFILLDNNSFLLKINEKENINIIGLDDAMLGNPNYSVSNTNFVAQYPNILLLHEPDLLDKMDTTMIDASFSGHSHGGQVNLPFVAEYALPLYGKKYVKGQYQVNESNSLNVSSGIGTTRIAARFMTIPEFVVYKFS